MWQYGSNLGEMNEDLPWLQDGVAPQCAVPNITKKYGNTQTGRVFIPEDVKTKSYLGSHSVGNYYWIFSDLIPNDPRGGYVKPR